MTNDQSEKRDDRLRFYHRPDNLHESLRELGRLTKQAGIPFYQRGGKLFEIIRINRFDGTQEELVREVTAGQFEVKASGEICWVEERGRGQFCGVGYDLRIVRYFLKHGQAYWGFPDLVGETPSEAEARRKLEARQARRKGAAK